MSWAHIAIAGRSALDNEHLRISCKDEPVPWVYQQSNNKRRLVKFNTR
jgi:hypothetical protein